MDNKKGTQKVEFQDGDLQITIGGKSETLWAPDLLTASIQHLIENADLHGWEKHSDYSQDDFFIALLRSITTVWKSEDESGTLEDATRLEILRSIISAYEDHPALAEKVVFKSDEDGQ